MSRGSRNPTRTARGRIRQLRWELVHAAGCCTLDCLGAQAQRRDVHPEDWSESDLEPLARVRIPRSLRAKYAEIFPGVR